MTGEMLTSAEVRASSAAQDEISSALFRSGEEL